MNTTDTTTTLKPIYGPSDDRWAPLEAWILEKFPERIGFMEELMPSERATWYEFKVLGNDRSAAFMDYPEVPAHLLQKPVWADVCSDESVDSVSEQPSVQWTAELAKSESVDFLVDIQRVDTYDPERGEITEGVSAAQLWLGGNSFDHIGQKAVLDSPDSLRELARTLLDAAEKWEQAAR